MTQRLSVQFLKLQLGLRRLKVVQVSLQREWKRCDEIGFWPFQHSPGDETVRPLCEWRNDPVKQGRAVSRKPTGYPVQNRLDGIFKLLDITQYAMPRDADSDPKRD
ncbi:MAG: hypothetical protein ACLP8S_05815 [Solirubrobacteraceae bacterium]